MKHFNALIQKPIRNSKLLLTHLRVISICSSAMVFATGAYANPVVTAEYGEITVTLPAAAKFTTASPVNLRGEKAGVPMPITASKFTFPLNAYAPASFILQ